MKRKVAIIGGGMGGLAAAFDLTRTQELRDAFDVTVYQLGWRLGGKAASSRDGDGRILEHGLHVWFGSYENAFELVRAAYADWDNPHKDQAILDPEAAFQAKRQTVLGSGDCPQFFQLDWLQSPGKPGDMKGKLSFWSCVTQMLKVIQSQYAVLEGHADEKPQRVPFPPDIQALMALIGLPFLVPLEFSWPFYMKSVSDSLVIVADWARKLEDDSLRNDDQLLGFVRQLRTIAATLISSGPFREQPIGQFLTALVDVGTAIVKGVILDMEIGGASVADLDRMDFREWLSAERRGPGFRLWRRASFTPCTTRRCSIARAICDARASAPARPRRCRSAYSAATRMRSPTRAPPGSERSSSRRSTACSRIGTFILNSFTS